MSDRVVVDASLAVQWVLTEVHTAEAVRLLNDWEQRQLRRLVLSWFLAEITNVLHKRVRRNVLTGPVAKTAVRQISRAVILRPIGPRIADRALELADLLGLPATYDAQYLALAEREGCELRTADERFWNAASTAYPFVKWLGTVTLPLSPATQQQS